MYQLPSSLARHVHFYLHFYELCLISAQAYKSVAMSEWKAVKHPRHREPVLPFWLARQLFLQ